MGYGKHIPLFFIAILNTLKLRLVKILIRGGKLWKHGYL